MELRKNRRINFLDITISINDGKSTFEIYRKPEYADQIIPNNSSHHHSHKHAALHSMLNRLLGILLSQDSFQKALKTIIHIVETNCYSLFLVEKMLKRKVRERTCRMITPGLRKIPDHLEEITLLGSISHKISNVFPEHIKTTFRSQKNLLRMLGNSKDERAADTTSGVYELSCSDCPVNCIGRTIRSLRVRASKGLPI